MCKKSKTADGVYAHLPKKIFDAYGSVIENVVYFDEDGSSIYHNEIEENIKHFSPMSDIYAIYYAELYGQETKGNYSACSLFSRLRGKSYERK